MQATVHARGEGETHRAHGRQQRGLRRLIYPSAQLNLLRCFPGVTP